jgi:hypothetical protein
MGNILPATLFGQLANYVDTVNLSQLQKYTKSDHAPVCKLLTPLYIRRVFSRQSPHTYRISNRHMVMNRSPRIRV